MLGLALLFEYFIDVIALIFANGIMGIGGWMVFEKAGERGWKALIPFYNVLILGKIIKKELYTKGLFWIQVVNEIIILLNPLIMLFISYNMETMLDKLIILSLPVILLKLCAKIAWLVFWILAMIKLTKAFDQPEWFTVGLVFVPVIFLIILGANKNMKYVLNEQTEINNTEKTQYQKLNDNEGDDT